MVSEANGDPPTPRHTPTLDNRPRDPSRCAYAPGRPPPPGRRADSPSDVDLMEVIKIPEVAGKRSLVEVLSQVVKLERSSSSSASEMTSRTTPEAPDIVTSRCRHPRHLVPTLCRACPRSQGGELPALVRAQPAAHHAQEHPQLPGHGHRPGGAGAGRGQQRGADQDLQDGLLVGARGRGGRGAAAAPSGGRGRGGHPRHDGGELEAHLGPARARVAGGHPGTQDLLGVQGVELRRRQVPEEEPRPREAEGGAPRTGRGQPEALVRERKPWTLRPLRSAKHKRDSRPPRKSSFSIFMRDSSKEQEKSAKENANASSPKLSRSKFRYPTVGVLSTKIQEIEEKIQEILHLEPVDIIMRENKPGRGPQPKDCRELQPQEVSERRQPRD
ncbi:hypothetical protein C7M84_023471 [Penaeus vannamei]|uniref:Uncharacterized protein n=1 Tax=Penaeus vannamei TaxID=6689 RepID=A0A3R7QM18_PENVA|nr:hypothetical protein C7M84_023471 [Penaeus vannamei]